MFGMKNIDCALNLVKLLGIASEKHSAFRGLAKPSMHRTWRT